MTTHTTITSLRRPDAGKPYWWARCTQCAWEAATGAKTSAERKARDHERKAAK